MTLRPWDELQLKFDLGLDEVEEVAESETLSQEQVRMISEAARHIFEDEYKPEWFRDYLTLVEQGWPWRIATYIAWASSPKIGRQPATLKDLAEQVLGLGSPRVINNWRRKYPSIETIVSMMQSKALWDHRADVMETLAKNAAEPDYKYFNDRKLFLEMLGDYVPKSQMQVSGSVKSLEEMSDSELERWMSRDED